MVSNSVTFASPLQPSRPAPDSPSPGHSQRNHHNHTPFSLRRKTMSVTQTYYLAHKARAKLAREASRADHDLRLLVGHANLLDGLMLELADAEREQESWFNNSLRGAVEEEEEERVQYEDTIIEIPEDDDSWDSSDDTSDSDSDSYDEEEEGDDIEMADMVSMRRVHPAASRIQDDDEEDSDDYDDDEDFSQLELVRTSSHSSPPELDDDEDSSEDESMPPSPPTAMLTFSDKDAREEGDEEEALQQQSEGSPFYEAANFFVPARNTARLVPAIPIC